MCRPRSKTLASLQLQSADVRSTFSGFMSLCMIAGRQLCRYLTALVMDTNHLQQSRCWLAAERDCCGSSAGMGQAFIAVLWAERHCGGGLCIPEHVVRRVHVFVFRHLLSLDDCTQGAAFHELANDEKTRSYTAD